MALTSVMKKLDMDKVTAVLTSNPAALKIIVPTTEPKKYDGSKFYTLTVDIDGQAQPLIVNTGPICVQPYTITKSIDKSGKVMTPGMCITADSDERLSKFLNALDNAFNILYSTATLYGGGKPSPIYALIPVVSRIFGKNATISSKTGQLRDHPLVTFKLLFGKFPANFQYVDYRGKTKTTFTDKTKKTVTDAGNGKYAINYQPYEHNGKQVDDESVYEVFDGTITVSNMIIMMNSVSVSSMGFSISKSILSARIEKHKASDIADQEVVDESELEGLDLISLSLGSQTTTSTLAPSDQTTTTPGDQTTTSNPPSLEGPVSEPESSM